MLTPSAGTRILRGPLLSTFYRYAVPWTLGLLLASSAGVIDGLFVGKYVGPLALASINIASPMFALLAGLSIMLASGASVRCGWYRGQKAEDKANALFTKTMISIVAGSILLSLFSWIFQGELVRFLGANDELYATTLEYLSVIILFFPAFTMQMSMSFFIRLDGRPNLAAAALMSTAGLNVIFDYLFIAQGQWGIAGAAWATGLSNAVPSIIFFAWHFFGKKHAHLTFTRVYSQWREVLVAAWNGISEMLNELSSGVILLFINIIMIERVGAYGVAAFTVIAYINWMCFMISYGLSDSLGPLVSVNKGAGKHKRARAFTRIAAATVGVLGLLCFTLLSFFSLELVRLFLHDNDNATWIALEFISYSRYIFLFFGFNVVITAYLTALLRSRDSAIVALLRGLLLPGIFLFLLPMYWGNVGVYVALPLSEALTLVVGIWLLRVRVEGAKM